MQLLLLIFFFHLVLILGPIEAFTYVSLFFLFHFILFDIMQFNYAQICVSFLLNLVHYFTVWEPYSFTSHPC